VTSALPYTPESYQLLHQGAIALAEIECNGMRVDIDYIHKAMGECKKKIQTMTDKLEESDVMQVWRKTFGGKTNIGSTDQLGEVLFEKMGIEAPERTAGGKYKADEKTLALVNNPFVWEYLRIKKLKKVVKDNFPAILREAVDGTIHNFFNLHTVVHFRSSSDKFNFHNIPSRDPEISNIVRSAFIAREGRQIVEIDFSGAEVRVAACYHKDPTMIRDILDPERDMHRDMALELFKLKRKQLAPENSKESKNIRNGAKGDFVFAQFYGSWYVQCAQRLWNYIDINKCKLPSGILLRDHMASVGLSELGSIDPKSPAESGTFVDHVRDVERRYWEVRYPIYNQWKMDWFDAYREQGWFQSLTGFICQGYMAKNDVICYPIAGSSFHCLLWTIIKLMRAMKKRGMKSQIVGQIHDSIVADVLPSERDEYIALAFAIIRVKLQRHWPWLIVPMDAEADVAPVGASWHAKKKYEVVA
jgi:DNA polymerase I-like protein with 3'-5' exonuclease and polymerase domains